MLARITIKETRTGDEMKNRKQIELEKGYRSCRKNRKGASVVEFAMVAPILILLIFGLLEFGRMVMVQQLLTNASREGARLGVIDGVADSEVQTRVVDYLANSSIKIQSKDVVVVTLPPVTAESGEQVSVTVNVPFKEVSWLPTPIFLGGKTMASTTTMRRETVE